MRNQFIAWLLKPWRASDFVIWATLFVAGLIFFAPAIQAQSPPTSVIAASRVINWSLAGAPSSAPIGTRSQCGSTLTLSTGAGNAAANGSTIRSALAACTSNEAVQLPSGTYYFDYIWWGTSLATMVSNVTLRGMGANSTFLITTTGGNCIGLGASGVCLLNADNNYNGGVHNLASWTGGYSVGTNSITINSFTQGSISNLHAPSGGNPGSMLILNQQDDASDTGNIYACASSGFNGACSQQGFSGSYGQTQGAESQQVTVTSISGSGPWTIGITPGIYAPNWTSAKSPIVWFSSAIPVTGDGLESMSIDYSGIYGGSGSGEPTGIDFTNAIGNWIYDVRGVNGSGGVHKHVEFYQASHNTVLSSYFYGANGTSESYGVDSGFYSSDNLVVNSICQHIATCTITEDSTGNVFAYNYSVDNYYAGNPIGSSPQWQQEDAYHHNAGDYFQLWEGDQGIGRTDDAIHGTTWMSTDFRNYWNGRDPALTAGIPTSECPGSISPCAKMQQTVAITLMTYSRYENVIGNVLGTAGYHTNYQYSAPNSTDCGNPSVFNVSVYGMGYGADEGQGWSPTCTGQGFSIPNDTFVQGSLYRFANCDPTNGGAGGMAFATCQFNSSEAPSGIGSYAQPFPSSHTLPNSFYLPSNGASPPPFWHTPAGAPPWPACGPDITGGNILNVGGHCNNNPAAYCYLSVMGGLTNGSSGLLAFDAGTCYPAGSGTPAITFSLTNGGSPITSFNFGSVAVGSGSAYQTFYVENTGSAPVVITLPISNVSGNTADFQYISNPCASGGGTIAVGSFCTITMQFVPASVGAESTSMTFNTNVSGSPQTIALSGTGTGSTPPLGLPTVPQNIMILIASLQENK